VYDGRAIEDLRGTNGVGAAAPGTANYFRDLNKASLRLVNERIVYENAKRPFESRSEIEAFEIACRVEPQREPLSSLLTSLILLAL